MEVETDEPNHQPPLTVVAEVNLHAQELDLNELHKFDFLSINNDTINDDSPPIPDTEIDLDGILPSESFSTRVSPVTSLLDGVTPEKTPIAIFRHADEQPDLAIPENVSGLPSPPKTPVARRSKDDYPTRCSDIEDSPPLQAAGFIGDEIPTVDPLDSDGEWTSIPTLADLLPTKAALSSARSGEESVQEIGVAEKKRKRKKKKKSKGVRTIGRGTYFN